jgi:NAD-dependent deacetylase
MKFSSTLLDRLANAEAVVAFTGAGASAESGVPTFRGPDGIWAKFKPEELASMDAFMRNPELVWEWYNHRRTVISKVRPNEGHYALARMESLFPRFTLVTQNVDNLHRRAGSRRVHELHGNIERSYCVTCRKPFTEVSVPEQGTIPRCECGGAVRPDVVWFGEVLPEEVWQSSVEAAERSEVFFSIGTSAVVYPAASLPTIARRGGAYVVEINPETTPLTPRVDEFLSGLSGVVLPELVARIVGARSLIAHL